MKNKAYENPPTFLSQDYKQCLDIQKEFGLKYNFTEQNKSTINNKVDVYIYNGYMFTKVVR